MSHADDRIDLETSIGYLLKEVTSALRQAMEAELRPLGVTVSQYSCLELLAQRPGLSSSDLARGVFMTRQSMSTLLQGLETDGLVSRPEAPPSGRALPVALTAHGRRVLADASARVRGVEDAMLAELDRGARDGMRTHLASCVRSLRALG